MAAACAKLRWRKYRKSASATRSVPALAQQRWRANQHAVSRGSARARHVSVSATQSARARPLQLISISALRRRQHGGALAAAALK